ncbi:uncharacterized protein LOC128193152 isoform X2 [Crassostrea angulata]|uniref:uncharacterized protein LOC128193152 isoform X2 n=1 Tax=Magallana angulata TaxID=2784310 RepID=UPI0022B1A622|nr:uncharacterized protein LOC128193152 isoform X2 [Crassostrea angulata]
MLSSEDKRTFANKLQRLKGDLEYFIWRIETSSSDVTETDKTRYCRLIIEIMEFVVKRIENKLRESQITKGQYSLQLDELKLKISKLEEELDKERTKSKTNTLPFWQNMTKTNTPKKLCGNEKQKPSKREVELESEKEKLKTQIQEQNHCIQNLEIERKDLYDRLSKLSSSNTASKDETEEALEPFPPVLPSMATRYSDLFLNGWTTAYKTLTSVVMSDHKVTQLLLQCLTNAFSICKTKAEQQRRILQDENLTEGLSNPAFIQDNPRQIMEMQIKNASEIIPEISKICRDKVPLLGSYPPEVAKYADDCVDLCWSMVIQSPPFHLSWASPHGEMVDTSKYTFYRTSGHYVDYVVWPVLLDCEGGTVVSKGVVQGRN